MAKAKAAKQKSPANGHVPAVAGFQTVPLDSLHLDGANVRRHPEDNLAALESSLVQFGPARSIVVDGNDVVRAGNGTVEAAHRAGITEVLIVDPAPGQMVAVRRRDWSPTQATAYAIGDNAIATKATWDEVGLGEQLRALQSEDFDLSAIGYDAGEVDALIEGLAAQAAGADEHEQSERSEGGILSEKFEIIVQCRDEGHQREVFDRLQDDGLDCRVITF